MLAKSDFPIDVAIKEFARYGVEAAYIVPTDTGIKKSIVDAHHGLRVYLRANDIHDFEIQPQGPDYKVKVQIELIHKDHSTQRDMSLYRPKSKTGDPRLWIGALKDYVKPYNLVAIIATKDGRLYAVDCSDREIWATRDKAGSPLNDLLTQSQTNDVAEELLGLLRSISAKGFIKSLRNGPTGIGFTLETLLGIKANSSRAPDYKGIELKSGRRSPSGRANSRSNLFSQVPDWNISNLKSGREVLKKHGYWSEKAQRSELYVTVTSKRNRQGLLIITSNDGAFIDNLFRPLSKPDEQVVRWVVSSLHNALSSKHKETFWVKAGVKEQGGTELFHYHSAIHTRAPLVNNFEILIDTGKIHVDYTLSEKPSGGVRDHGYLFKIWPKDLELLFPPPLEHDLTA